MNDLEPADFIRLDLFPSLVIDRTSEPPIQLGDQIKVVITHNAIYGFVDGPTGKPITLFKEYLEEVSGDNKTSYIVSTASEKILEITRAQHCGCGSTLKGYFPFPGVAYRGIKN